MAEMPPESVDSIVCDPPYGLEFMGKVWDKLDWQAGGGFSSEGPAEVPVTIPASRLWEGWGTALKPAWEPVIVGKKPVGCAKEVPHDSDDPR